ncbi:limonene-1,2-epoxide hydrolase family protein [Antrihabitans spumae]|uniref:Limonene-1,2-epoxide hydrolase family protein n=1 Tax=Antrihabitans spumae TaxID=3373370 RepID=A0ABW7K7C3_9NOCA
MTPLSDIKQDATTTVREFLGALEVDATAEALELVTDDVEWINNSLSTARGAGNLDRALSMGPKLRVGFAAHIHHIAESATASSESVVLTERTDVLRFGPVRIAFWVCGTFELRDGKIAIWHDYFSWANFAKGTAVGLTQAVLRRTPALD